jgi:DNA replication protein DnaC
MGDIVTKVLAEASLMGSESSVTQLPLSQNEEMFPCRRCEKRIIKPLQYAIRGVLRSHPEKEFCEACETELAVAAAAKEEQDAKARRQERIENIEEFLAAAGVPKRLLSCSLENFQGKKPQQPPGFITGPPGIGKTHLAVAFLRQAIIYEGKRIGRFVRNVDLLKEIRDSLRADSSEGERAILEEYGKNLPLLILDDLGAEKSGYNAWKWWRDNLPNARYCPVPAGKDPTEAQQQGVNLRAWVGGLVAAWT